MKRVFPLPRWTCSGAAVVLLGACAGLGGGTLTPGVSALPEVLAAMGQPAMRWKNADGGQQLAFPRGPTGTQTYMAYVAADGKLQRLTGVLNEAYFSRIESGMTQEQVLRILGPSGAPWTVTYPRTRTLTWSWLFCPSQNLQQYFDVNFDADTGLVRAIGQHQVLHGYLPGTPPCKVDNIDLQ